MSICGNMHEGMECGRPVGNHPRCTGFDEELDDFRDWDNPNYVDPHVHTNVATARETKAVAMASTAPDRRVGTSSGFEAGMEASERAAERWTAEEKAKVVAAVVKVCEDHAYRADGLPGHDEFTADDIWDELAGEVPVTKALASVLNAASKRGLCDTTGKTTISRRQGQHGHGQRLSVWYSLVGRG
jgi:hypothetical protein